MNAFLAVIFLIVWRFVSLLFVRLRMSPKQFKLTHSLFSFQRISQADGAKRKQTKANESICPPQRKNADGSDGAVESVQMKENMQQILEAEGLQRNDDGTGEIRSSPTPWHPSHALAEPTWKKSLMKEFQMKYMTEFLFFSLLKLRFTNICELSRKFSRKWRD